MKDPSFLKRQVLHKVLIPMALEGVRVYYILEDRGVLTRMLLAHPSGRQALSGSSWMRLFLRRECVSTL